MSLPGITFNVNKSGLGRPLAGEDHISGIVFYAASLPSGFGTDREKQVFSLDEAQTLGIAEGSATFGVLWYHIREYFRIQPDGNLFVGIYPIPSGSYDFAEVSTLQNFALGKIRQVAVFTTIAGVSTSNVSALNTVCTNLKNDHKPLIAIIAFDISAVSDLATLADLRQSTTDHYVSVVIGQDGDARGKDLYDSESTSITCLGAVLGAVSLASVHESIGYVRKFKLSDSELDVPAFANGELISTKSESFLASLNTKGYIFLRTHTGITGSYLNDGHTCVQLTNDLAYIKNNRTIQKALRNVRTYLLPEVLAPVELNATTGQLSGAYVESLRGLAGQALNEMVAAEEISGFEVLINPEQNVQSTGEIVVTLSIVPYAASRTITVNLGFSKSLS